MDYLQLAGKNILVLGVANRKSVAWHSAKLLLEAGANVIFSVRSEQRAETVRKLAPNSPVIVCDVERQEEIDHLRNSLTEQIDQLHGIVHSVAFADYSAGWLPFHETPREAFLQAVNVSCFSLIAVSTACRDLLDPETRQRSDNFNFNHAYGSRKLRLHGSCESSTGFINLLPGQVLFEILKRSVQCSLSGTVEDIRISRNPRIC